MSSLTRSKQKTKKQHRRKLTKEEKFQRQWNKVQRLQKQNEKLKGEIAELVASVTEAVEAQEKAFTNTLYEQTLQLIKFVAKKTLPQYLREELVCWIEDNIEEIHHNPFARHLNMQVMHDTFLEALDDHLAIQKEKLQKKYAGFDFDEGEAPWDEPEANQDDAISMEDMFEDLFAEFAADEDFDDDDLFEEFIGGFDEEGHAHEEQLRKESQALDGLLKSSSINKLFRKVVRAIHPDLARDDAEREQKHNIMTRLTTARDNKDIVTILSMYTEYVGEPPTDLFANDLDKMILLLNYQEQQLEQQKDEIVHADPWQSAIYNKFAAKNKAQFDRNVREHKQMLARQLKLQQSLNGELTSLAKLKPVLRERMESRRATMLESLMEMEDMAEFFGGSPFR